MTYSWRLSSGVELGENDRRTQKGAKYTWSPLSAKLEGTRPTGPMGWLPPMFVQFLLLMAGPILSVFPALIVHSELKSVHPGFPVAFIF